MCVEDIPFRLKPGIVKIVRNVFITTGRTGNSSTRVVLYIFDHSLLFRLSKSWDMEHKFSLLQLGLGFTINLRG